MHGLGNDFAVFDARKQPLALSAAAARALADRRRGIGCDQLIVIEGTATAPVMRVFNADGGEAETCGNAARCVARILFEESGRHEVTLATKAGPLLCRAAADGLITVDMGVPEFHWNRIPLAREADTDRFTLDINGEALTCAAVSIGNPHCILFVADAEAAPVASLGPRIETDPFFPNRTNVEFVSRRADGSLRMRVWERGAGITPACGSGASAVAAVAHRRGLAGENVTVELDGGVLALALKDGHVLMTGPAELSYRGEIAVP